ncbi:hypothetical protein C5167_029409 [Papaver somniferum]|uniref:pentatricopeptide repeat-containing protein At1g59720, chloroplastic/mitochondrial-like n=1 Tax=Papaver somniferum TaxID=3469 RepID=UPI000E6FADAA|nr:pentatricopeptide repeat-containing protein At1g59720, chloroplastic/mitochondrial-like [Papaver somniferum]RZC93767.1 hypothetical protein C5167_029409 [Papaver somniferum]
MAANLDSSMKLNTIERQEQHLASLVQRCPNTRLLNQIHSHLLKCNLPVPSKFFVLNKLLVSALSPLISDIDYARRIFSQMPNPNIFTWNTMIRGCSQMQNPTTEPIVMFQKLIQRGYPNPNSFTYAFVIKSCAVISGYMEGRQIHSHVLKSGFHSSPFVQTALVNLYAKCEEIGLARKMFDEIPDKNLVTWSTIISGYARIGLVNEALSLFREMQFSGVNPDEVTMVSVITACASSGALDLGEWVHKFIEKHVIKADLELNTALVHMYAKCGCIERARKVFEEMPEKDTKAWSSMMVAFAIHGLAEEALQVFTRMLEAKVKPNHVTFIGVLSACAHSGLVSEGQRYWSSMLEYGIEPTMEHYGCMVDLLCRAGLVKEAYKFVEDMPVKQNSIIWRTLLVGCTRKGILDEGDIVAGRLLELEPLNPENYVLLSNLYAATSQWGKVSLVRKKMKENGIRATPGCSSIEIDGFVHEFVVSDTSHPEGNEIREVLRDMADRVRSVGHDPWTSAVLHNVDDEEKESSLCEHSERLAIAYGLLKTKSPTVIRVVKNLRVCADCHEVTKIISKVYRREIIVRDRVRYHRFLDGACSCKDYW